jgi:hypothetical protein
MKLSYSPKIVTAYFDEQGIPEPQFEYKFHETRKWRFDLAWPAKIPLGFERLIVPYPNLAIEVQGGLFSYGGHNRGAQIVKEHEKYNEACAIGWRILYCQPKDICTQDFANLIKRALNL